MGLEANVGAVVAALDLKLVRLLRAAMAPGAGPVGGLGGHRPTDRFEPRQVHEPEPRIEPRKVIHPEPRFEPRPVHRPEPKFEPAGCDCPAVVVIDPSKPKHQILPPWKQLPPVDHDRAIVKVKLRPQPPDIISKGSLIDSFM